MSILPHQAGYRVHAGQFDLLALVEDDPQTFPALLQSTAQSLNRQSTTARYDILFCYPRQTLCKYPDGRVSLDAEILETQSFLTALDEIWRNQRRDTALPAELPFRGGWLVYLGYELAAEIEPVLDMPRSDNTLPLAMAMRIGAAVIYDHEQQQTIIVTEPDWTEQLEELERKVLNATPQPAVPDAQFPVQLQEEEPQRYLQNVERILAYIREGDVFQVNLSRRWTAENGDLSAPSVYRKLRMTNPGPFAGFMQLGKACVLSSSPERLVEVRKGRIATRPIAGTRPRDPDPQQDEALIAELITHPKERAEHVMLIDLERNDLGRICIPGTVTVNEHMIVESYAHVHHIVSNVTGELRADVTPADVIAAVFPGGTITGCPKVRCMQIIAELEGEARGAYTGSFGYINHDGDMDLNILIRTIVVEAGQLSFRAGAGIVADSLPEKELEETRAKAKGMRMAITGSNST